ncbi:MAG: ABC-F family ATP-binding cassette domain-containing protein [Tabrizicola sp.]|nr:ABC-F family ATP-binding cassette domain-containing protein [Tabrizicola sp.]
MTLISLKDAAITLGAPLFSNLNLTLHPGNRMGIVAPNGRGKSTFLRALAGQGDLTSGSLTRRRGLITGYLEQDVPDTLARQPLRHAVLSALSPEARESEGWRADIALDDLSIPAELHDRPVGALSGGWQRFAMLARVWVTEPDVLLLDEPTNELDLARIGLLQRWIRALPRETALIVASHDRAFLDDVCTHTLFLRPDHSAVFALPYGPALVALDEADAAQDRQYQNDLRAARQLRRQAAKLKNIGINSGSDLLVMKTKQLNERAARLEDAALPAHQQRSAGAIRLGNSGSHAKALIAVEATAVLAPDGRRLFRAPQLWIGPGERVVLLGANGVGKSRFLDLVIEGLRGAPGPVRAAPSVVAGISDQRLTALPGEVAPHALIAGRFDIGDQPARTLLAGAGIAIALQGKPIRHLSGGQKARLAMLMLRLAKPNFYLLDEPTNHLDIEGQEALETELASHGAAALIVSHDRSFVRTTGTRFWWIRAGALTEVESPEPFFAAALGGEPAR